MQYVIKNVSSKLYGYFKDKKANSVDSDEVAHYEAPHLEILCLQSQLNVFYFSLLLNNTILLGLKRFLDAKHPTCFLVVLFKRGKTKTTITLVKEV